jgi:hypothetical protein
MTSGMQITVRDWRGQQTKQPTHACTVRPNKGHEQEVVGADKREGNPAA